MSVPVIHRLSVERFRSIRALHWRPRDGVNILLGGGDVGKTSILDAIGLLLSPVNPSTLSDAEYLDRQVATGFTIEAVVSLPSDSGISDLGRLSWPWAWNGTDAVVPNGSAGEEVYRVRVRGTEDLELVYEIVQPDGSANAFPVALRRAIGLVRLSGDDRNDRDLRLVQGSALDRLLSDRGLRARLASDLAKKGVKEELTPEAQKALQDLDRAFHNEGLPEALDLAMTGGQGMSVASLIGLTAERGGVQLPLASWGAGTRRIASLAIAEQKQGEAPIALIDELERGLEPYRQRALVNKLQAGTSQAFVTTHSPFVIAAASEASLWFIDHAGNIGMLDRQKTAAHRKADPETFLAFLSVICEGAAEEGFVTVLLEKALGGPLERHGFHVSDGGGHESTLGLLEALADGGLRFGGFADEEDGKHPERWQKLAGKLANLLFRWSTGCLETNVIDAAPEGKLEALLTDPNDDKTGLRLRTLADRLGIAEKDFEHIEARAGADLRKLIADAALGTVPPDKGLDKSQKKIYEHHAQCWFKSVAGGRELAEKISTLGLWPSLKPQLLPFCNAMRKVAGLPENPDFAP